MSENKNPYNVELLDVLNETGGVMKIQFHTMTLTVPKELLQQMITASHPYSRQLCWQRSPPVHSWSETTSPFACSLVVSSISPKAVNWAVSQVRQNQPTERRKNTKKPFPF